MIAAKIKEGVHYAVNPEPRKGVKEDELSTLTAFRVVVRKKGCQRFAKSAKSATDQWGTGRAYRMDGIRALRLDDTTGKEDDSRFAEDTWKARDFLMPWDQYVEERKARADKLQAAHEAQQAVAAYWDRQRAAIRNRLRDEFGLLDGFGYVRPANPDAEHRDFVEYGVTGQDKIMYGFSHKGLEKLLGSISDKVYEIVSAME